MKKLLKRVIALIMLMTICVTSIYTSAYAQTSWDGVSKSRVYEEDGFKVIMSLSSYWNGGYNADIKIENTSDTAKENWYLGFEYDDVISNIWNAEIVTNESGYYVIKNAIWNQDIAPKSYVQFGFSSNEDFSGFPDEINILGTSVELSSDDYIIDYKLDNDWGNGFVSTMSITNISEDTIEDWVVEFDYDREITNIWNGTIESHEGNHYVIKNAGYNANIGAGQSITFGFNGCDGVETDVPYNYKLIAYKVLDSDGDGIPDAVEGESETDVKAEIELYAFGFYNDENNSVDIEWCTNYENGEFEIWHSNDNLEYTLVENVGKAENYQYDIVDDFEMKYFKVVMLTECGESIESFPVSIVRSEEGYTTALIDTDNDNIADMLEKIYGTDYNKFDTDSDGLSDYQEIFVTLTDPIVYDSVVEGVADSDADSDSDGISNINEISIETNPVAEDTDEDGLKDGDEVNAYGTNPIVEDTDEDGLKDGDEPYINLDPMNPETYDVPDSEYVVLQQIASDSEVFLDINTADSPYKMSIDVKASGYVEGGLVVEESNYMSVIENDAMLGVATEISYSDIENIEELTLKFEISEEYLDNTLNMFPGIDEISGIKRLNVFQYFEELNMLLPIETQFDVENNIVYAKVSEIGTYCIMDMEVWFNSFEVPEDVYMQQPALMSLSLDEIEENYDTEDTIITYDGEISDIEINEFVVEEEIEQGVMLMSANYDYNVTPIDVAFLLQTSGQLENTFEQQKNMIISVMNRLVNKYGDENVRFCIVTYNRSGASILSTSSYSMWFTDSDELSEALDNITYQYTSYYTDRGNAFRVLQNNVTFRENASKFIFQVMNGSTDVGTLYFDQINTCERLEINYSELMPEGYYYISSSYGQQVYEAICSTNGVSLTYGVTSANDVYNHICNYSVEAQTEFAAKLPLGWKKIILDGVLDPYNGVNSDEDNLTDWKEVKSELLKWDTNGNLVLPTVEECMDTVSKYTNGTFGATKVLNIYDRFELNNDMLDNESLGFKSYVDYILDYKVLPINSDPTEEDSDNDGLLDGTEVYAEESNGEKRVIAPKDPEPLKKTGISGIWKEQINQEKNGVIATDYADNSIGMGLSFNQFIADNLITDILKWREDLNENGEKIRTALMAVKKIMEGDTVGGAFLLNFIYDDKHIAYHSQVDTWQRDFGYNDLYDDAFRIGSYMHYGKAVFEANDKEYTLWLWKGDYWNLQSGAEIGLYVYDKNVEGTQHYDVVDFEMPMTLSLYNYYSSDDIENLFNWQPEDDQWWITGFNPEYKDANPEYMVAMGKIDFTGHEELFDGIKNAYEKSWKNISKDNMIFDEDGHTLWIMWDYGV